MNTIVHKRKKIGNRYCSSGENNQIGNEMNMKKNIDIIYLGVSFYSIPFLPPSTRGYSPVASEPSTVMRYRPGGGFRPTGSGVCPSAEDGSAGRQYWPRGDADRPALDPPRPAPVGDNRAPLQPTAMTVSRHVQPDDVVTGGEIMELMHKAELVRDYFLGNVMDLNAYGSAMQITTLHVCD